MKRDMELARQLLLTIESNNGDEALLLSNDWDRKEVAYHLKILDQAGFVENRTRWADNQPYWIYASLTWEGHEFLDSVRNDNIWNKTKEGIKTKGLELGSIPIEVIKEFAKIQIKNLMGLE